jgi:hypothetical protein
MTVSVYTTTPGGAVNTTPITFANGASIDIDHYDGGAVLLVEQAAGPVVAAFAPGYWQSATVG